MSALNLRRSFMSDGGLHVADTNEHVGEWHGLLALEDTVVASITCPLITGAPLANIAIYAGNFLPFPAMTAFTLASGDVIAIN